jgi:hypothetical protein
LERAKHVRPRATASQLDVEDFPDIKSGFRITFRFEPGANPYFSNAQLSKVDGCDPPGWLAG